MINSYKQIINVINNTIKNPSLNKNKDSIIIYCPTNIKLKKDAIANIPAGFIVNVPSGYIGLISPVKKMGVQNSIVFPAQILHSGYDKEITLNFTQHSVEEIYLEAGSELAQINFFPCLGLIL